MGRRPFPKIPTQPLRQPRYLKVKRSRLAGLGVFTTRDVPKGTLANWRYLGRGPVFVRLGRHVRYRADDLASWIEHGKPITRSFR